MKYAPLPRLVFIVVLALCSFSTAQGQNLDNIEISLLTCDQGDGIHMTFGHSALRVKDYATDRDIVYNYGTFDYKTPGFVLKFMRGKLPYRLAIERYSGFIKTYTLEKRGVVEQILDLNSEEKAAVLTFLRENLKEENRFYPYDFFFDNCSTRLRDIIPAVSDSNIEWPTDNHGKTYRDLLHEHLTGMPWSEFGIDLIIGSKADKQASIENQMFLPQYLYKAFAETKISKADTIRPLVQAEKQIISFEDAKTSRKQTPFFTPHIIFLALFLLEVYIFYFKNAENKWVAIYHKSLFILVGIASLIIIFLWGFTDHQATRPNWNLLWASPLYFIYPFLKNLKYKLLLKLILLIGIAIALANTIFPFLPQVFNFYNTGIYAILLLILYSEGKKLKLGKD